VFVQTKDATPTGWTDFRTGAANARVRIRYDASYGALWIRLLGAMERSDSGGSSIDVTITHKQRPLVTINTARHVFPGPLIVCISRDHQSRDSPLPNVPRRAALASREGQSPRIPYNWQQTPLRPLSSDRQ
jgi:hypothetical protein